MRRVDLTERPPPAAWGVEVDDGRLHEVADRWAGDEFGRPAFSYAGLPGDLPEAAWFDYCVMATSVVACLWPTGGPPWSVEHEGSMMSDAPALFACFTRALVPAADGLDLAPFARMSAADGERFFAGRGELQFVPARAKRLAALATTLFERWDGHAARLVESAGRDAGVVVELLVETLPGYRDESKSTEGLLPFNKLAHLAAALMSSRADEPLSGLDRFQVYPDYILPMVLRHHGVLVYESTLASAVDLRAEIPYRSNWENAIRWATVHAAARLRGALNARGNPVTTPALDYALWWSGVLGPGAGGMGEHHRTPTLAY